MKTNKGQTFAIYSKSKSLNCYMLNEYRMKNEISLDETHVNGKILDGIPINIRNWEDRTEIQTKTKKLWWKLRQEINDNIAKW